MHNLDDYQGVASYADYKNHQWVLVGPGIITCPAIDETIDIESCVSANHGEGCMYIKNGKCCYEKL